MWDLRTRHPNRQHSMALAFFLWWFTAIDLKRNIGSLIFLIEVHIQ